MDWQHLFNASTPFIITLLIVFVVILICYAVRAGLQGEKVLVSELATSDELNADLLYYLPAAELTLKAVARMAVNRDAPNGTIRSVRLLGMSLDSDVHITPDTDAMIALKYKPFLFANDELDLIANESGLLENIVSKTEDRIGAIVADVANAAGPTAAGPAGAPRMVETTVAINGSVTEILELSHDFLILPSELDEGNFTRHWTLQATGDGGVQNGRLDLIIGGTLPIRRRHGITRKKEYPALLTRPLIRQTLQVSVSSATQQNLIPSDSLRIDLLVPDRSKVVAVPVKRYPFIANQYNPKFSHGLLMENRIRKPSEFEGFVGIPIRIAKALMSIPAELLQFRITRTQQLTTLADDTKKLQDALAKNATDPKGPGNRNPLPGPGPQGPANPRGGPIPLPPPTQFGRKPPSEASNKVPVTKLSVAQPQRERVEAAAPAPAAPVISLGAPQPSRAWQSKFNDWPVFNAYNNITKKTCTPAAAANMIIAWTSNLNAAPTIPALADVMDAYQMAGNNPNPGDDTGCGIFELLTFWKTFRIGPDSLNDFAKIAKGDQTQLQLAINWYGAAMLGFNLPAGINNDDPKQPNWEIPMVGGRPAPGLDDQGHTVAALGYTSAGITVISWGRIISVSWAFYAQYSIETWMALSGTDWAPNADPAAVAPSGATFVTLDTALVSAKNNA